MSHPSRLSSVVAVAGTTFRPRLQEKFFVVVVRVEAQLRLPLLGAFRPYVAVASSIARNCLLLSVGTPHLWLLHTIEEHGVVYETFLDSHLAHALTTGPLVKSVTVS